MNILDTPVSADQLRPETATPQLSILLVQGNPLVRLGMRSVLEHDGMMVRETTDTELILDQIRTERPDVILLDGTLTFVYGFGEISAVEMVIRMRQAATLQAEDESPEKVGMVIRMRQTSAPCGIFLLMPVADEESLFQFMKVGAAAYELDMILPDVLVQKVKQVARGEYIITSEVLPARHHPIERGEAGDKNAVEAETEQSEILSGREIEVLQSVMLGLSNKEISRHLQISDQTVKNHLTTTLRKLEAKDRTAAVVVALRLGLLSLSDFKRLRDSLPSGLVVRRAVVTETALTSREIEVLQGVQRGWPNHKIGRVLKIGTSAVRNHLTNMKAKLGVQDRTQLVQRAQYLGYLKDVDASHESSRGNEAEESYALVANG